MARNAFGSAASLRWVAAIATLATAGTMLLVDPSGAVFMTGWALWILAPPVIVAALSLFLPADVRSALLVVLVALSLAFGPVVYARAALGEPDAQGPLVFVFVPLWQLVGLVVAGIAALIAHAMKKGTEGIKST